MTNTGSVKPTAALALADGTVFLGRGHGAAGLRTAEIVFNTAITGYQEILTDPSYAGQIVTFTFPHIGNVGVNGEDVEATTPHAAGAVFRAWPTEPSNWRAERSLDQWLADHGIGAISGIDTRRLTRHLRDHGAQNAALQVAPDGRLGLEALKAAAAAAPSMVGQDLAKDVSATQRYGWDEALWDLPGYAHGKADGPHVVAVDYGIKSNILRSLAEMGCRITVVPATTTSEEILALDPDGVLFGNGPGDPAATGEHAVPVIRKVVDADLPVFGICLGHQLLGLALGAKTTKMRFGHHGANHPVKDFTTGKVEITSQNHGFAIDEAELPDTVQVTHRSLFDGTIQGIALAGRPVFSVQYHPEASPGPVDSQHLFRRFVDAVRARRAA
ncbi:MAG TPA: glutamine-hydrolyzing carbamoyl-phosphate synthase small subunit [Geminicoccus sp.]|uniref:glutamine-hydrolyzing carbamoyl-phosphate synthase small subunit n=1 Tax=Geminicoccus sp. TaxID=2024832 RepID=UPI002E37565A|nr:glutamine-hydrolyzing carbamoyl-phosphate synthase small subunit [Geminicoccus sp.]HEX2527833.1 glutamine-hydrolyzing carbamoyl-phosphate synthase small subunit [Geminicoccus sp.]